MQLSCARHLRVPRLAAGAAWHNPMVTPDVRQWNRTKGLHSAHPDSAQISGLTGRSQGTAHTGMAGLRSLPGRLLPDTGHDDRLQCDARANGMGRPPSAV